MLLNLDTWENNITININQSFFSKSIGLRTTSFSTTATTTNFWRIVSQNSRLHQLHSPLNFWRIILYSACRQQLPFVAQSYFLPYHLWTVTKDKILCAQDTRCAQFCSMLPSCKFTTMRTNIAYRFNVLLTAHHAMILGKWPTWRTNSFQCIYLFTTLYMFRARRAHHQERQIVLIQLLVTVTPCWWQCRVLVGSRLTHN
jgi:hypothetical protein